jgi:hypothetical protein
MGLYYSYFKTILEADSLPSGVYQLYRKNHHLLFKSEVIFWQLKPEF